MDNKIKLKIKKMEFPEGGYGDEPISSYAVLDEVLKIIDSMYADSEHYSLRQYEKWFAKGKNFTLNELKEKILSISVNKE